MFFFSDLKGFSRIELNLSDLKLFILVFKETRIETFYHLLTSECSKPVVFFSVGHNTLNRDFFSRLYNNCQSDPKQHHTL